MMNVSTDSTPVKNTITVSGTGRISVTPDTAVLRLGVQTNGYQLEELQADNANRSAAVLQAVRQLGVTDITTYQYEINRVFDYQDGKQTDAGYVVRNIFEIRTNDIPMVGGIIDAAVNNGANVIDFINFEASDRNSYYLLALNQAVADAYEKAGSVTEGLGIGLNPLPISITESGQAPVPLRSISYRGGEFSTPVEAGNIQIDAGVVIVFHLQPVN